MAFFHQSTILFTVQLTCKIGHLQFEEQFMVFETLSAILLGFPFFDKNDIIIDAHKNLLQIPDFTFQLNLVHIKCNNKQKRLNNGEKVLLQTKITYTLSPGDQKFLELIPLEDCDAKIEIELVEPTVEKLGSCLATKLSKLKAKQTNGTTCTTTLLTIKTTEVPLQIRQCSLVEK